MLGAGMLVLSATPALAARHAPAHRAVVHRIVIAQMQYGAMPAEIHVGDVLEWINRDLFEHSVTARDGSFDLDLPPGTSRRMIATAGAVTFFCKFHPGMTATLVVK
jgi:plastocyanin